MKKYNVEVVETLSRVVEVEANNYEEAEEIVEEKYSNSDIVLDWNDLECTEYNPYPSREINQDFKLNVDFDKTDGTISIGSENGSGTTYKCKTYEDLLLSLKMYCQDYIQYKEPICEKNSKNKEQER